MSKHLIRFRTFYPNVSQSGTHPNSKLLNTIPIETSLDNAVCSDIAYMNQESIDNLYNNTTYFDKYQVDFIKKCISKPYLYDNNVVNPGTKVDTQLVFFETQNENIFAFRGTDSFRDVLTDLRITRENLDNGVYVHKGFFNQFKVCEDFVLKHLNNDKKIVCTGHSLGGGLATLCAYMLVKNNKVDPDNISCVTFGSPRVGNKKFSSDFDNLIINKQRIILENDPITLFPTPMFYKHVSGCTWIKDSVIVTTFTYGSRWLSYVKHMFTSLFSDVPYPSNNHKIKNYINSLNKFK